MEVKEVQCKSCLNKSKLTDYVINPYTGCQHGCKYCYAVFIKKFQDIKAEWGEFVYPKVNCVELLKKEIKKRPGGHIWMSSVTDPYHPIESKYKLTRQVLEVLAESSRCDEFSLEILTKSSLVKRDFDLLKQLKVELGCSLNTLDRKVARLIEPLACPPADRIETLKAAKEAGIHVFGFISPVIPGITNLEELFRELSFCEYVWVELLNTKPSAMQRLMPVIRAHIPSAVKEIQTALKDPNQHFLKMEALARNLEKKYGLRVEDVVRHDLG